MDTSENRPDRLIQRSRRWSRSAVAATSVATLGLAGWIATSTEAASAATTHTSTSTTTSNSENSSSDSDASTTDNSSTYTPSNSNTMDNSAVHGTTSGS